MAGELFPSAQRLEFHQEREKNDLTAGFFDQFDRGASRTSGGLFQVVRNGEGGERQLAFFTDRDVPYS